MANQSTTHVIEIRSGIGEPAFIPLSMGHELQPISIGKKGMWRVDGARVLDVHAFVYFDGSSLFLQSADELAAVVVDGHRVGKAWTELHAPCQIEVGAARLRYRSLLPDAEGHATQAAATPPIAASHVSAGAGARPSASAPPQPAPEDPPPSFAKPARPFKPGAFASTDDESTQLAPVETTGARTSVPARVNGPNGDGPTTRPEAVRAPMARPSGAPVQQAPAHASGPYAEMPQMPPQQPPMPMPAQMPPQGSMPPQQSMTLPMAISVPGGPPPGSGAHPQQPPPQQPWPGPSVGYPPVQAPPPQGSLPPGGYGSMTQSQREPQGLDKPVARFKEMSPPKRIGVILLPIAVLLAVWSLLDEDKLQPRPKRPVAAADASAGPTATPAPATSGGSPASPTAAAWPPNVPCPPPGWPANLPPPCIPNGVAPPKTTAPVVMPGDSAPPTAAKRPPLPAGAKSLQRQAVDAVAAGDYAKAASLYEQLAKQDPNSSVVFVEAARILRARMDGGAP